MTAALHFTYVLSWVLPGLGLLTAVVACLIAFRRGAVKPDRSPFPSSRRPEPERSRFDREPAVSEISKSKQPETPVLPDSGRHILFVDDERHCAESGRSTLSRLGYRVTLVADANEALAAIHSANEKIDCLVTDLSMPGMSGFDLARICQHLLPGVPVILMSGHEGPIAAELLHACGIDGLLLKPFTRQTLAEAVQRVLVDADLD